jgi:hypothetical protein
MKKNMKLFIGAVCCLLLLIIVPGTIPGQSNQIKTLASAPMSHFCLGQLLK